jgi:hypothetical protein
LGVQLASHYWHPTVYWRLQHHNLRLWQSLPNHEWAEAKATMQKDMWVNVDWWSASSWDYGFPTARPNGSLPSAIDRIMAWSCCPSFIYAKSKMV